MQEHPEVRFPPTHDPEVFRAAGHRLIDRLSDYLGAVPGRERLLRWREPRAALLEFLEDLPREGVPPELRAERLADLLAPTFVEAAMHMHHPLYLGHQVAVPAAQASLADMVVSFLNPAQAVYEISPGANAIEAVVVRWLARLVGFDDRADGLVLSGGSIANLTALLAARNAFLGDAAFTKGTSGERLALIVSPEHHYSISRAALILGIGGDGVISADIDARRRLIPESIGRAVEKAVSAGRRPFVLCASAGSTPIGAFDPLEELDAEARRHGLWFHVDAAHGGTALLSPRHRAHLGGIERADSVTWDPHKMMFMPAALGSVLFRDGQRLVGAFFQDAPYLFDAHHPELGQFDIAKKSIACTQRADCVKLWACLKIFGADLFGELYERCCAIASMLHAKVVAADDFEALHVPESNILCFRHVPAAIDVASSEAVDRHNAALRAAIVRDGRAYLTPGSIDGRDVLRAVVMNPMTEEAHIDRLLEILREVGARLA